MIQSREKVFKAPETIPHLPLVRGKLYTYLIIAPTAKIPVKDSAVIDCGFNFWRRIPTSVTGLKAGAVIQTEKRQDTGHKSQDTGHKSQEYTIIKSDAGPKGVYTYKAYLEKIIDGDTIWLNIDVGFRNFSRQKVRFNRIDTPEIKTELGPEAKAFIEKILKPLEFFIVKTYKYDKYTRYLVDVFYLPGEKDAQTVADQGRLLNQELLDAGLALAW